MPAFALHLAEIRHFYRKDTVLDDPDLLVPAGAHPLIEG